MVCHAHDGGSPFVTDPDYLTGWFLKGAATAAFADDLLVAAGAVREINPTGVDPLTAITGLVHPAWRGRGIGGYVLNWALNAATSPPRVETEMLTAEQDALFRERGLRQTFGEDVMRAELVPALGWTPLPAAVRLREWSTQLAAQFFAVYTAAFADRPGFPGWSCEQWIEWISDDPDFAAGCRWRWIPAAKGEFETNGAGTRQAAYQIGRPTGDGSLRSARSAIRRWAIS